MKSLIKNAHLPFRMLEIEICDGAECKREGSKKLKETIEAYLKDKCYDYVISKAGCSGNCPLGPVVRVNGEIFNGNIASLDDMIKAGLNGEIKIEGVYEKVQGNNFGIAVDLGTTNIEAQLIDLKTKKVYGTAKTLNKQRNYGITVTERLNYAKDSGFGKLQSIATKSIDALAAELAEKTGAENFEKIVIAGNTAMSYFFFGEDPKIYSGERQDYSKTKKEGSKVIVPSVSGFIGGDITAGMLYLGFDNFKKNIMLIDLGTNGEVALASKENKVIIAASASAGPAFEGGGFKCGMPALEGAISSFSLKKGHKVIGSKKAKGICGTGMLDLVYELYSNNVIDGGGNLQSSYKETARGKEYFVTDSISISEHEIKYFIDSKAAIFATIQTLLKDLNMKISDLDIAYVAGGFGKLDTYKSASIGLLPKFNNYKYTGNTSLKGAKLCFTEKGIERAERLAQQTTTIDLVNDKGFYEEYMAARFLPHTNKELFE